MIRPRTLCTLLLPNSKQEFIAAFQELLSYMFDPHNGQMSLTGAIIDHGELFKTFLKETFNNIYQNYHPASDWNMVTDLAPLLSFWRPAIVANRNETNPHDRIFYDVPSCFIDYLASLIYLDSESSEVQAASEQVVLFLEAVAPSYPSGIDNYRKMDPAANLKYISQKIQNGSIEDRALALSMVISMWYARDCPFDTKDPQGILLKDTLVHYDKAIQSNPTYKEALIACKGVRDQDIPWIWSTLAFGFKVNPNHLDWHWQRLTAKGKSFFIRYYMKYTFKTVPRLSFILLMHPYYKPLGDIIKTWPDDEYQAIIDLFKQWQTALQEPQYDKTKVAIRDAICIIGKSLKAFEH